MKLGLGLGITRQKHLSDVASIFSSVGAKGYVLDANPAYLFQDMVGTPVTTPGQTAQLALDPSQGLAVGVNLIDPALWLMSATGIATSVNSPSGTLTLTGNAGTDFAIADYTMTTVAGRWYKFACTVATALVNVQAGTSQGGNQNLASTTFLAGSREVWFCATAATTWIRLSRSATGSTVVSGITCKHIAGVHNIQPTAAARPIYGIKPFRGRVNEANGSADVGNVTYWPAAPLDNGITATKIASGLDTDGLPYVDVRYQGTATSTFHDDVYAFTNSRTPAANGQTWTTSILAQRISGGTNATIVLVVSEDNASSAALGQSFSAGFSGLTETVLSVSRTFSLGGVQARLGIVLTFTNGATIDVTYRLKGLQFERAASRSNYQFNYSQYNVTEPGQPTVHYLRRQTNKWMQTAASVDLSDRDCVAVVVGMRKMSDAARGFVMIQQASGLQRIAVEAPSASLNNYAVSSGGTINLSASETVAAPTTDVVTMQARISTPIINLRRNGVQKATQVASQGTGNYSNRVFYSGAADGTSSFVDDELSYLAVVSTVSPISAGDLSRFERVAASKCGVVI